MIDTMLTPGLPRDTGSKAITGPLLLTHLLQWGFFGALSVQVYIYYLAFPKDPLTRKILVYAVYATELTQTILYSEMAFKELAAGFGSDEALNGIGNFWFSIPILSSIVAFAVQTFYASRIRLLAKSNFIAVVVFLFALVQLGGGIATGVLAHQLTLSSKWIIDRKEVCIWIAGSVVCDITIAVSMTYYLSRLKTSWKPIQRIIQKLILLIIGTGTLTATIAIISFVLIIITSQPPYYDTTCGILGKTYSTTMMVVLNNRIAFQTQDDSVMPKEHLPSVPNQGISPSALCASHGGILVTRERWTAPLDVYNIHGTRGPEASSDNVHSVLKSGSVGESTRDDQ